MMKPAHYLAEHDLTPTAESIAAKGPRRNKVATT